MLVPERKAHGHGVEEVSLMDVDSQMQDLHIRDGQRQGGEGGEELDRAFGGL